MTEIILRPHQEESLQKLRQSYGSGHKRPVLQAPCGFGKSYISMHIIKSALKKGKRVYFCVNRVSLIDQVVSEFSKHGLDFGVIQGQHLMTNSSKQLQIASIQTLVRRTVVKPGFFIQDEMHNVFKGFNKLISVDWDGVPGLGLSASPFTKNLAELWDDLVVVETTQSLIDKGYLSDFECWGPDVGINLKGIKIIAGDYSNKELAERVNKTKITGSVVDTWVKRGDNRKTVCFAVNIAHSEAIVEEFNSRGIPAEHLDAYTDDDDRRATLARHESGETKILSNVGITTTGWDSPDCNCLIYARPCKSLILHTQMLGRVLRKSSTHEKMIILDFGGSIARLGFPTDALPEYLDTGEKQENAEPREAKEILPKPCPKCTYLTSTFPCSACGFVPEKNHNVEVQDGELKKLKKVDMKDKIEWFGMLKGYARERGFKDGWAYHKFHEKFEVYPTRTKVTPAMRPNQEVRNWITHINIRRAKSKHI